MGTGAMKPIAALGRDQDRQSPKIELGKLGTGTITSAGPTQGESKRRPSTIQIVHVKEIEVGHVLRLFRQPNVRLSYCTVLKRRADSAHP